MGGINVTGPDALAFVADAVHRNDPSAFYKEPQHPRVQLADVPQLKKTVIQRLGQRLAVVPAIAQFCQARCHRGEVVTITGLKLQEKFPHGRMAVHGLIKLYGELHARATSILMCCTGKTRCSAPISHRPAVPLAAAAIPLPESSFAPWEYHNPAGATRSIARSNRKSHTSPWPRRRAIAPHSPRSRNIC